MKSPYDPMTTKPSFTNQLRGKSRRRRDELDRMAKAAATPRLLRNDVLPLLAISYVPLTKLRQTKRKLRRLDPVHVREVANAIGALGFCHPILVGRDNEIIDGEVRFEAARLLGLDAIPCVRIDHLSPDEQRVLRLAVNRLAEKCCRR